MSRYRTWSLQWCVLRRQSQEISERHNQSTLDPIFAGLIHTNDPLSDSEALRVKLTLEDTLSALSALDGEISKALLALLKLEKQRRLLDKYVASLKTALSPIRRIPPEILAEIFLLCRNSSLRDVDYSVADPRHAPTVLTHVSSRWREVCMGSPRLWDHLHLQTHTAPPVALLQSILARTSTLPLSVNIGDQNAFQLALQQHDRLEHLHFHIRSKLPRHFFDQRNPLPLLSSLHIIVGAALNISRFLTLFNDAPQLKVLYLKSYLSMWPLASVLPWSQFTRLNLDIALDLLDARDILSQCEVIQECELNGLLKSQGLAPSQHVYRLAHLHELTISLDLDYSPSPELFFDAFSFPNLRSLNIAGNDWSPDILPNLHARSDCSLMNLKLHNIDLSAEDLIQFLRLTPTLQTLHLSFCCVEDDLLQAFTYEPDGSGASFSLPQLRSLTAQTNENHAIELNGALLVAMAESVSAHPGGQNAAFPALMDVTLWLAVPRFEDEIEARLQAACTTGLVKDDYTRRG
ncbi:hypothetical protein FB451DRAFT_1508047 [Mycena latifolia]|nr:hypothetical protein FB451DRAFT_1508047 [Mycena latifolia]